MKSLVVTVPAIALDTSVLDNARSGLVNAVGKTGEVVQNYADVLCGVFNVKALTTGVLVTPWYELRGKAKSGIKAEKAKFYAAFSIDNGFAQGTDAVYWQRVKIASGYITAKNRVKGTETVDDKTMADLKTILNRIFKSEEDCEDSKSSEYKGALMDIFAALGGDVMTIG